jgi:hypothetical protein
MRASKDPVVLRVTCQNKTLCAVVVRKVKELEIRMPLWQRSRLQDLNKNNLRSVELRKTKQHLKSPLRYIIPNRVARACKVQLCLHVYHKLQVSHPVQGYLKVRLLVTHKTFKQAAEVTVKRIKT